MMVHSCVIHVNMAIEHALELVVVSMFDIFVSELDGAKVVCAGV